MKTKDYKEKYEIRSDIYVTGNSNELVIKTLIDNKYIELYVPEDNSYTEVNYERPF